MTKRKRRKFFDSVNNRHRSHKKRSSVEMVISGPQLTKTIRYSHRFCERKSGKTRSNFRRRRYSSPDSDISESDSETPAAARATNIWYGRKNLEETGRNDAWPGYLRERVGTGAGAGAPSEVVTAVTEAWDKGDWDTINRLAGEYGDATIESIIAGLK